MADPTSEIERLRAENQRLREALQAAATGAQQVWIDARVALTVTSTP